MGAIRQALAAAAIAATLAACTSASSGVTPAPVPAVTLTKQQQAYEADAAMTATNGIRLASLFAAIFKLQISGAAARAAAAKPVCKDGVEQSVTFPTPENIVVTIDLFYDPACRTPFVKSKFTAFVHLPSTVQLTGTQTTYDPNGKAVAYGNVSGTSHVNGSASRTVLSGNLRSTPSGPDLLAFGLTCDLGGGANECGFGAVNGLAVQGTDLGFEFSLDGFVGSGAGSGHVALKAVAGKPGSLSLKKGFGHTWIVTGGSNVVDEGGTYQERVHPNYAIDVQVSLADTAADAASGIGLTSKGMSGSVVQSSIARTAATFHTAPDGSGSIAYSDGTTGRIVLFIVAS